jgi:thiol-disulfide isomerase/thioredoxin
MRLSTIYIFVCLIIFTVTGFSHAQRTTLGVGSTAPGMDIAHWVKGNFNKEESEVYVVEFWATTCAPCRKSIPHLTALQQEFGPAGLTIIAVTNEDEDVVEPFVKLQGSKMDYTIAIDNRKKTSNAWMRAAKKGGIPTAFIVDRSGTIQYIGSPLAEEFDSTLVKVMAGRYDLTKQLAAASVIKSARRSSAGQSWSAATKLYNEAIEMDKMVFAKLYIEQFRMLLLEKRDTDAAYAFASKIITTRGEEDPELLTWLADAIAVDSELQQSQRRMNTAILAAETALKHARIPNDPLYLSAIARIKFHNGDVDDAIDYQRRAYFAARENHKTAYKNVLDGYRRQKQRADAA